MAYDKIIPIRSRLDHCVNYAINEDKTGLSAVLAYAGNEQKTRHLVTGLNCEPETAFADMQATKCRWDKRRGVLGYHIIHSYAPGETTPEKAHAAGVEFAQRLLGDRYEVVVATHLDREHLHCHIVFNSVSFVDGRRYRNDFKAYFGDIRSTSNEVSREHGLSVIEPEAKGKHYAEWDAERRGKPTVRGIIRKDIDDMISKSYTYKSFLMLLRQSGYEVKTETKYTAVKPPGGSRYIRLASLGNGYSEEDIKTRLGRQRKEPSAPEPMEAPRHYRVTRGNPRNHRPVRRGSLRALYLYYRYLLSPPRRKRVRSVPFEIRTEAHKLERYQRQFLLLHRYRIETRSELSMLNDAIQAEIDALVMERKGLYQKRRGGEATGIDDAIQHINDRLRPLRKELKLCCQIESDIPRIRDDIQMTRQHEISRPERGPGRSDIRWK